MVSLGAGGESLKGRRLLLRGFGTDHITFQVSKMLMNGDSCTCCPHLQARNKAAQSARSLVYESVP